jgi:hypothetical protein
MCLKPTCTKVFEELLIELFTREFYENESVYLISHITRQASKDDSFKSILNNLDLSCAETYEGKKRVMLEASKIVFSQYLEDAEKGLRGITFLKLSNVFSVAAFACARAAEEDILPASQKLNLPHHLSEKMRDLGREMGEHVIEPLVSNRIRELGGWGSFNYAQSLVTDAIEKTEKRKADASRNILLFASGVGCYLIYYFFFK